MNGVYRHMNSPGRGTFVRGGYRLSHAVIPLLSLSLAKFFTVGPMLSLTQL